MSMPWYRQMEGAAKPATRYVTWPERLAQTMWKAATLSGDVYAGRVDPNSQEAIERSADLAGALTLGSGALPAAANEARMGIKAYHGSPHDFDKFSMEKIGTGEGAQAYGHGMYFAEEPKVAGAYKTGGDSMVAPVYAEEPEGGMMIKGYMGTVYDPQRRQFARQEFATEQEATDWAQGVAGKEFGKGRMYEVDINASPDEFLDWDKPLSEQSSKAVEALRKAMNESQWSEFKNSKAGTAVRQGFIAFDDKTVADKLRAAGIKGIRYKDAGSRGKDAGTSNYVVFDADTIKILKKYGIAGLTAGLGAASVVGSRKEAKASEKKKKK